MSRVAASLVHPDDAAGLVVDGKIDLDRLRGRIVRMTPTAACTTLGCTRGSLVKMTSLGLVKRGGALPPLGGIPRSWLLVDPAHTKRDLYIAFLEELGVPRSHFQFDRYLSVRDVCGIPASELPPPFVVEGMTPLLLQLGTTDPSEIGAFTPHTNDNDTKLRQLVIGESTRAMRRDELPQAARPTDEMILVAAPGLRGAPGTAFGSLVGSGDLGRPKDDALRIAWALGPARGAALLWAHLASASRRSSGQVRAAMRRFVLLDRALVTAGGSIDVPGDVGAALEEIAYGDAFADLRPGARATAARMLMTMIRQISIYATRNDPDGSRGIRALVPAEHPQRLAFASRIEKTFQALGTIGRENRKSRSDRMADDYERILDVAALRIEQIVSIQRAAHAAAAKLRQILSKRPAGEWAHDDHKRHVEFGVMTTVMTPDGRLLPGSQTSWFRAWRERDMWMDLGRRGGITSNEDNQIFLRQKEIRADPSAYDGIVFEWVECRPEVGEDAIPPWFVHISNLGVLNAPGSLTAHQRRRRHAAIVNWKLPAYGASTAGLLAFDRVTNTLWRWASRRKRYIVPIDEFAYAMRFAAIGLHAVDECLCRVSELLQMRQDREMWPTSAETGISEVSFLAFPKSSRYEAKSTLQRFQVDQTTFVEATALASEIALRDGHPDGLLPEVPSASCIRDRFEEYQAWIFQSRGTAIENSVMNRILRFLLANVVDVSFHELRHAAANAARQAGLSEAVIQRLMNHRTPQQTRWYYRRTARQRLKSEIRQGRRARARYATRRSAKEDCA